jgi:hypothetical protein
MSSAGVWLAVFALAGVSGCTGAASEAAKPHPMAVRLPVALDRVDRTVFVVAARQKPRIVESLAAAGITVSTDLLAAGFMLRVTVGADQGFAGCGTRNNVKYSLRHEDVAVLDLVDKGWTGTCRPNVFDAMSQRLALSLESVTYEQGAPRAP